MLGRDKNYFAGILAGLGLGVCLGMYLSEYVGWPLYSEIIIVCFVCITIGSWLAKKWARPLTKSQKTDAPIS